VARRMSAPEALTPEEGLRTFATPSASPAKRRGREDVRRIPIIRRHKILFFFPNNLRFIDTAP